MPTGYPIMCKMCPPNKKSCVKSALKKKNHALNVPSGKKITRKMCPQEKKFTRKMCLFEFFAPAVKNP